ncbi:MAG: hypothetical protein R2725_13295 [Solirubrobacterales bacterium]
MRAVIAGTALCLALVGCGGGSSTTTVIERVREAPAPETEAVEESQTEEADQVVMAEALRAASTAEGFSCAAFGNAVCQMHVEISRIDPRWAAVHIEGKPGHETEVQAASASFYRQGGEWKPIQIGNGGGCEVPSEIVAELLLDCF